MRLILILASLVIFNNCTASPPLNLCIDSCKHKQSFMLGDDTWTKVQDIFTDRSKSDEAERQQIARAILLIHRDIDKQMNDLQSTRPVDTLETVELSSKELTRNLNEYIALLLDQQFINRHFLRKTEQRSLFISTEYASSIQSHNTGDIFALLLEDDSNELKLILPLEEWKHAYSLKNLGAKLEGLQKNNAPASSWDDGLE